MTAHRSRHPLLRVGLPLGAALLLAAHPARAEVKAGPEIDAAVEKGLAFLARQQQSSGAISDGANPLATTGLAVLAYLSAGHTPDAGRHGLVVRLAVDYLVKSVPQDGYVGAVDGSRMYGQGIVALALAEAYGVETSGPKREQIRLALRRMIEVILKAQRVAKPDPFKGGWRYEPGSADSDLSLSGWSALALRAAQNIGMNVAKEPVDRAVGFVHACFRAQSGGFGYQPGQEPTIAMTSVAVLNLHLLDAADNEEAARAAKWLAGNLVSGETRFFYYSLYYSTQAAAQVGGELYEQTWQNNRKLILAKQQSDGGFAPSPTAEEPGRVYATSMAVVTLAIPFETLPIYQR